MMLIQVHSKTATQVNRKANGNAPMTMPSSKRSRIYFPFGSPKSFDMAYHVPELP